MPRRVRPARRSPAEWSVRIALALATAGLGHAGVARSIGYATRSGNVTRAHVLAPNDGRVTALLAQSVAGVEATAADRRRADDLARRALRQDPTAVAAVATLGLDSQLRGDATAARRLFAYAERLSRRDLRTQVWKIEAAVADGDVTGALHHYDIALRTSRDAPDLLFPILVSAMSDPAIRIGLVQTLRSQPLWTQGFLEYAAAQPANAWARALLFADLTRVGTPISASARSATVDALVRSGRLDRAWTYYATVQPGVDRHRSRDPDFRTSGEAPSLFDWTQVDAPGASVTISDGMADVAAAGNMGGPVMRQLQLLSPGTYRLDGRASFPETPSAPPYWTLTCLDGRELGRVYLSATSAVHSGRFTVPAECGAQYLSLVLQSSDNVGGAGLRVDRALLAPAR